MGYALVCFSAQVSWAAGRQVFPTWGHLIPKRGIIQDYTQRLRRPGSQASMQKGAGPPRQAVCRVFSGHQLLTTTTVLPISP